MKFDMYQSLTGNVIWFGLLMLCVFEKTVHSSSRLEELNKFALKVYKIDNTQTNNKPNKNKFSTVPTYKYNTFMMLTSTLPTTTTLKKDFPAPPNQIPLTSQNTNRLWISNGIETFANYKSSINDKYVESSKTHVRKPSLIIGQRVNDVSSVVGTNKRPYYTFQIKNSTDFSPAKKVDSGAKSSSYYYKYNNYNHANASVHNRDQEQDQERNHVNNNHIRNIDQPLGAYDLDDLDDDWQHNKLQVHRKKKQGDHHLLVKQISQRSKNHSDGKLADVNDKPDKLLQLDEGRGSVPAIHQFIPYAYERGYAYSIKQIGPPTDNIDKLYPSFLKPPQDPPELPSASLFPAYHPQVLPGIGPKDNPKPKTHQKSVSYTKTKPKKHKTSKKTKKKEKYMKMASKNRWNLQNFDKPIEDTKNEKSTWNGKNASHNTRNSQPKKVNDNPTAGENEDKSVAKSGYIKYGKVYAKGIEKIKYYNYSSSEATSNFNQEQSPLKNRDPISNSHTGSDFLPSTHYYSSEDDGIDEENDGSDQAHPKIEFMDEKLFDARRRGKNIQSKIEEREQAFKAKLQNGKKKDNVPEQDPILENLRKIQEEEGTGEFFYSPPVYRVSHYEEDPNFKANGYVPYKGYDNGNGNLQAQKDYTDASMFKNPENKIKNIQVKCDLFKDTMEVKLDFNEAFDGIIYTKGYFKGSKCKAYGTGTKQMLFTFPLDACGTEIKNQKFKASDDASAGNSVENQAVSGTDLGNVGTDNEINTGGDIYYFNTIIILNEAKWAILDGLDRAFKISCHVGMEGTKKIQSYLRVPMFHTEETAPFEMTLPEVWMKIVQGRDPFQRGSEILELGNVGSLVVLLHDITCSYDLYVFNCFAHDGYNQDKVKLIDENGCPAEKNLILPQVIERAKCKTDSNALENDINIQTSPQNQDTLSLSPFKIFKFPDQSQVYFECHAKICFYDCYKPKCGDEESQLTSSEFASDDNRYTNTRRRRRQASQQINGSYPQGNSYVTTISSLFVNNYHNKSNVMTQSRPDDSTLDDSSSSKKHEVIPFVNKSADVNLFQAIKVRIRNIDEEFLAAQEPGSLFHSADSINGGAITLPLNNNKICFPFLGFLTTAGLITSFLFATIFACIYLYTVRRLPKIMQNSY